jgi:hypothetical protein
MTALWLVWGAGVQAGTQVDVPYSLKTGGQVSLAVYDGQGRQIRTLLSGDKQDAGKQQAAWDGLDWAGKPAPAGTYEWRLLQTQGLKAEYLMQLGISYNDGAWPCNNVGPHDIACNGEEAVIAGSGEFCPAIAGLKLKDGKRLGWGRVNKPMGDIAMAGDRIFYFAARGQVISATVEPFDGEHNTSRVLAEPIRRIRIAEAAAGADAEGWEQAGLEVYTPERGYGWENAEGLSVGAAHDKNNKKKTASFIGVTSQDIKAGPKTERWFVMNVPNGTYTVRMHMGDGEQKARVSILAPGKDGKIKEQRSHWMPPEWTTSEFDIEVTDGKARLGFNNPVNTPWHWSLRAIELFTYASRLTANREHFAVAYGNGRIEWLGTDKNWTSLGKALVDRAQDIAVTNDGSVLAVAGKSVWQVSCTDPKPKERITGLNNPIRIAVDQSNGDILVVDDGGYGQVKRFSKDFKLLRAYGRAGGRQDGLYNPQDFSSIKDICADQHGGFLIVESWSAPRRLAHFDKAGKVLHEWYGGQTFFTTAAADPGDVNRVWLNSHWGWVMEMEVDYNQRSWKPRATYLVTNLADGLFKGGLTNAWSVRRHGADRYLVRPGESPHILYVDEENRRLLPMVASTMHYSPHTPMMKEIWEQYNKNAPREKRAASFLWQDANGDGALQKDEVSISYLGSWGARWCIDDDFNYYFWNFTAPKKDQPGMIALRRLAPLRWEGKRPVYPTLEEAQLLGEIPVGADLQAARRNWEGPAPQPGDAGEMYQVVKGGGDGFTGSYQIPAHSGLWPTSMIGEAALCKWSAKEGLLWRVGKVSTAEREFHPGALADPGILYGKFNDCILLGNRIVMPLEAWTSDGLFFGGMFDRRAEDGRPPAFYQWWRGKIEADKKDEMDSPIQYDLFAGGSFAKLPDGDALFFSVGWNNAPVYRISGWNQFSRQSGKIELKKAVPAVAGAGTGLKAEYFGSGDLSGPPAATRLDAQVWFAAKQLPDMRGFKPWPELPACKQPAFSARWTGFIEPRFSESYTLKAYLGKGPGAKVPADRVRLWVDGKLVIDGWERGPKPAWQLASPAIPLCSGQKVPVKIEYATAGDGCLHLCWESRTQEIEHIPAAHLYPVEPVVVTYPAPAGEPASDDYAVEVEGQPLFVYRADVLNGGPASFATFDSPGPVRVSVTARRDVQNVQIRPLSYGIVPTVQGRTITFQVPRPCQPTIEINGTIERPLHLFVNPLEVDPPRSGDQGVLYFGPGVHEVGTTLLRNNQTVYLAGGAIVRGVLQPDEKPVGESFKQKKTYKPLFLAERVKNVTIRGRGILDMSRLDWHAKSAIVAQDSSNVRVEGIVLKDSPSWGITLLKCKDVSVSNVKQICHRENSDGIDIVNSQDVTVDGCFLRNNDDEICVKTTLPAPAQEAKNIVVRKSVIWNDRAYALGVTYETRRNISNVLFSDCDVIHDLGIGSLAAHVSDSATVSDLRFENIRLEDTRNRAVRLWIGSDMWGHDPARGHIRGVVFKDIRVLGSPAACVELTGHDAEHRIEDVTFENLQMGGRTVAEQDKGNIRCNDHVEDIRFKAAAPVK